MTSPGSGFQKLLAALDGLNIPYFIGGSLASSIHGIPRATVDVDVVVALRREHIPGLVAQLGSEFYVDLEAITAALESGRAFNVIHYASAYKFDLFPLRPDDYGQAQLERRTIVSAPLFGPEPLRFPVASAEDTLLEKLCWYKAGGEVSERQWNDIAGIVRVSGARLDRDYLRHWAKHLNVVVLLERAFE